VSVREIARRLGRAPSTISRELRRNASPAKGYRPFDALAVRLLGDRVTIAGASKPMSSCDG